MLAKLNHPNIVSIYGLDAEQFYIVMEYLASSDLARTEDQHPGYCREQFEMLVQSLLSALAYAHDNDVLHRDIKLENILVSQQGIKLADFGLARLMETEGSTESMFGTLTYMPPEVIMGQGAKRASDVYQLGILFYRMWCGRFPFTGSNYDVTSGHISVRPQEPCDVDVSVPRALGAIIMKMLEKDPDSRFACAADVLTELRTKVFERDKLVVGDLEQFQASLAGIFAEINKDRDASNLLVNLQIRIAGISRYVLRTEGDENRKTLVSFICKAFGWTFALATNRRIVASQAILWKYRNRCPYCQGMSCSCPAEGKKQQDARPHGEMPAYRSFDDMKQMFRRIYGARNVSMTDAAHRLHVELGELAEAITKSGRANSEELERMARDEIADVFAWLFAVSNLLDPEFDISEALVAYYDHSCPRCGKSICRCDLDGGDYELLKRS